MRVRTHEHRKRTASSKRVRARSYGLLPLHTDGDFNDKGTLTPRAILTTLLQLKDSLECLPYSYNESVQAITKLNRVK
ncbi:hypothetical protein NDU88_003504 [Pleurodeles waltl]|uniref:Uncharacterized protein n=1 Tax=Pleurodeles waltl TaxID=8319 RepID=A0AAV7T5N6_PLEWA|nr:hypothetical protein NDU88_003504 [Pleurodeles waltl]